MPVRFSNYTTQQLTSVLAGEVVAEVVAAVLVVGASSRLFRAAVIERAPWIETAVERPRGAGGVWRELEEKRVACGTQHTKRDQRAVYITSQLYDGESLLRPLPFLFLWVRAPMVT